MRHLLKLSPRTILTAILGIVLLLYIGSLQAETVWIQPGQLTLSAAKPVSDLQIRNTANQERTVNLDIQSWHQVGNSDQLRPSDKLIVHPQTVRLQPGESARIRVALKLSGPLWEEQAFQLELTELPPIPNIGSASSRSAENRLMRRSSVPVFLQPPGTAVPRVSFYVNRDNDGIAILSASNGGRAHVQLNSASLAGPDGQSIEMRNLSSVILPGGTRTWRLMEDVKEGLWRLKVNTDSGPMEADLELEPGSNSVRSLTLVD